MASHSQDIKLFSNELAGLKLEQTGNMSLNKTKAERLDEIGNITREVEILVEDPMIQHNLNTRLQQLEEATQREVDMEDLKSRLDASEVLYKSSMEYQQFLLLKRNMSETTKLSKKYKKDHDALLHEVNAVINIARNFRDQWQQQQQQNQDQLTTQQHQLQQNQEQLTTQQHQLQQYQEQLTTQQQQYHDLQNRFGEAQAQLQWFRGERYNLQQ